MKMITKVVVEQQLTPEETSKILAMGKAGLERNYIEELEELKRVTARAYGCTPEEVVKLSFVFEDFAEFEYNAKEDE